MFKKPKRHFRQRKDTEGSENEDELPDGEETTESTTTTVLKKNAGGGLQRNKKQQLHQPLHASNGNNEQRSFKDSSKKKLHNNSSGSNTVNSAPVISFEMADEEDEGEAFQVKKSSQSRKIVKRLKKEKKEEKAEGRDNTYSVSGRKNAQEPVSLVLNGDRALDMELDSDYEPEAMQADQEDRPKHAFRSVLERGEIPDANFIHLARKKRAQAREQGDFIPLDDTQKAEATPTSTQRLVRDDDNDLSDEERVDFTLNAAQRDRQKMKDSFLAAEHGSDEDSDSERLTWEQEQLRKVVGGREPQVQVEDNFPSYYSLGEVDRQTQYDNNLHAPDLKPLPDTLSVDEVKRSLSERLANLKIVHDVHMQEKSNVTAGLIQSKKSTEELANQNSDSVLSKLNSKYTFLQQHRSYVRDLLDCFNEKYAQICELDQALMSLAKNRSEKLCRRRREDIKDEASACSSINKAVPPVETPSEKRQQAVKQRRVADRDARRTRRRQARQLNQSEPHFDGLSSDDEENNSDVIKYSGEREKHLVEAQSLFEDVVDDFSSISSVLDHFEQWKKRFTTDYDDAYVGLCLPKLLSPLLKVELMDWNPLENNCPPLSSMTWFRRLVLYGHTSPDSFNESDADNELIPMIVEKVLVAKLTGYVEMVWDPLSSTQTNNLANLLNGLVDDYPTLNTSSKNTATLMKAISTKISVSLDEDTFMPLFTNDLLKKSSEAKSFLHRQIWSSIKLYRNILAFSRLLSDEKLKHFALDSLLNRYIMLGLQCAGRINSLHRIKAVTDALPSHWLHSAERETTLPQLENLCRYMRSCATSYQQSDNRDDLKALLRILVNIHAHDHARWLSEEFSLRMPK